MLIIQGVRQHHDATQAAERSRRGFARGPGGGAQRRLPLKTRCLAVTSLLMVFSLLGATNSSAVYSNDLGEGWTVSGPDGYELESDGAPGFIGNSSTYAKPTRLIVGNWDTLDPVKITFTHTGPDAGFMFFSLRMQVTNKTNKGWSGFKFSITDDNGTPKAIPGSIPEGDNLFHPFHAHYHVDHLNADSFEFETLTLTSPAYSATFESPEDRGVYDWMVSEGHEVAVDATWSPRLIVMHKKMGFQAQPTDEKFTISLQAVPVPEPSSALLLVAGWMVCCAGARTRRGAP